METALPKNNLRLDITNKQILSISLPISLSLLVPFLNFTANNYFISGLGEGFLGTAGITGVYFLVVAVVGNGLNNALQSLIARRAGENRVDEIGKLFSQGVRIALIMAATGILLTYFITPFIFDSALQSKNVDASAIQFLQIRVWGLPFLYLFQMGNAFLVGTNNSRFLIIGTFVEAGANIFFDYSLINGYYGMPKLGFNGAAYASILAEFIGMVTVYGLIVLLKLHRRFQLFYHLRYNKQLSNLILNIAAPLIGQFSISLITWLLFYILIERNGKIIFPAQPERALAISNVMRNIFSLTGVFVWAFASTTNAMVSNIIGQGRKNEVMNLIKRIMFLSLSATTVMFLLFNLFAGELLSFFQLSSEFVKAAVPALRIVTVGMMFMSFSVVWLNAVTGTGNTRVNLLIEAVTITVYIIYVYLILEVLHLDLVWAWASEIIYWICIFTMSFLYMQSGKWKSKII
ncbi:MAG: MATE family efflux transporter [Chitinophagaceae bacterium]|nr:MATE family efflux transporter [Chitinophagaceae bacterium]